MRPLSRPILRLLFFLFAAGLAGPLAAQEAVPSSLAGLTRGQPVRLAGARANGYLSVTTLTPAAPIDAARLAQAVTDATLDLSYLGVDHPSAEQLGAALAARLPLRVATRLETDPNPPTPAEQKFARLAPALQALLRDRPPEEALRIVEFARQNLIALGVSQPSTERLVEQVKLALSPGSAGVEAASAGGTSFPPVSPLVSPYAPQSP